MVDHVKAQLMLLALYCSESEGYCATIPTIAPHASLTPQQSLLTEPHSPICYAYDTALLKAKLLTNNIELMLNG